MSGSRFMSNKVKKFKRHEEGLGDGAYCPSVGDRKGLKCGLVHGL